MNPAPHSPRLHSKPSPRAKSWPRGSRPRLPSASLLPTPQPQPSAVAATGARLLAVSGEAFAQARYASDAAAAEALCRAANATIVLAPGTSRFTRVAAGVAHRLGGFIDTHITAIGGRNTVEATRWFYRQRVEAVISRDARPWFLLLDAGTHAAFAGEASLCRSSRLPLSCRRCAPRSAASARRSRVQQTIRPDAKMLFVAGAGWTKKQPDGQVHAAEAGELILGFLRAPARRWAAVSRWWIRAARASRCFLSSRI